MNLVTLTPRQALNKAYLKVKPNRIDINSFKTNLVELLDKSNHFETEEHHKNLVISLLGRSYYHPKHYINTKGYTDLVIHLGNDASTPVGVIIEAKKSTNKSQMITRTNLDTKAFHELILYYLRERLGPSRNLGLKNLIVTNCYEWFVFDAKIFEREFVANKHLVKGFHDFEAGRLSGTTTDFFYKEIASPAVRSIKGDVAFTYFDLRDYDKVIRNPDSINDRDIVDLYKALSPQHLLNLPFANDSNTLNREFYTELLHIIGLSETRDGTKRVIGRKSPEEKDLGSLIENAIVQLDSLDKVSRIKDPERFGKPAEQIENVALELAITWINRVLFLKLLEAQLLGFHRGHEEDLAFLNIETIPNFDSLNCLFFQVLAREPAKRAADLKRRFPKVPYLNSSLFEPTELEHETVFISSLQDGKTIKIASSTVLTDDTGSKRTGSLGALAYLFDFLDAYDFSTDRVGEVQEANRSLISASVLGLIFEKINGYKDGSFFTPSCITMHMCRDVIRRTIVKKFNVAKGWACADVGDLYDKISDRSEANAIINSLRLCDPAVGSGHFLVSALNEVIALKAELEVLQDRAGKRLKNYQIEVVNDDLIITDEDGDFFVYNPQSKESQRVQECLFHEKLALIEGCLFGVDVNQNSVNICRLRLWIELLKHTYYRQDGELETLPNIDINIKTGDSLISRFLLDADLTQLLQRKKLRISDYRKAVQSYQSARTKEEKRLMQQFIEGLKGDFKTEIFDNGPKVIQLRKVSSELKAFRNQYLLFELTKKDKSDRASHEKNLVNLVEKLTEEVNLIRNNAMFARAFEWRFEFPEVLNDDGSYLGFDAVIGNPPYGVSVKGIDRQYLVENIGKVPDFEIYYWFLNRASQLLRAGGTLGYIIPNTILFNVFAADYRQSLFDNWKLNEILDCTDISVFVDAGVRNCIVTFTKERHTESLGYRQTSSVQSFAELVARPRLEFSKADTVEMNQNWGLLFKQSLATRNFIRKLRKFPTLHQHFQASQGYIPYRKSDLVALHGPIEGAAIVEKRKWHSTRKLSAQYIEELWGGSLTKYGISHTGSFVKYGKHVASYVDLKFFRNRRLLIREISNPIIAAIVDEEFVNDPQIISVIPIGQSSLEVLWAIFNSRFARYYHFNSSPKATKGLFPKLLVLDVNKFPFPANASAKAIKSLSQLVLKAFAAKPGSAELAKFEMEIEMAVFGLYDLTPAEIQLIDDDTRLGGEAKAATSKQVTEEVAL